MGSPSRIVRRKAWMLRRSPLLLAVSLMGLIAGCANSDRQMTAERPQKGEQAALAQHSPQTANSDWITAFDP